MITTNAKSVGIITIWILCCLFVWGQDSQRLDGKRASSQRVRIVGNNVSYAEALRELEGKMGVPFDVPSQASTTMIASVNIDAASPLMALRELLRGSSFGYRIETRKSDDRILRVIISAKRGRLDENALVPAEAEPQPPESGAVAEPLEIHELPVSEAEALMGERSGYAAIALPGTNLDAQETPRTKSKFATTVRPISDAAAVMGLPSGVDEGEYGKTRAANSSEAQPQ